MTGQKFISTLPVQVLIIWLLPLTLTAQVTKSLLSDNKLKTFIDSAVQKAAGSYMQDSNANGISIGIYRNGQKYFYNYGEIKKGSGILPTANDFYNIGSVAKLFVATMLAQAVVEKKANLDEDIRKYLPGNYPNLEYAGHPVRLSHLANHTSGLPNSMRVFSPALEDSLRKLSLTEQVNFYALYNEGNMLADLHQIKPDTLPGVRYRYNSNGMSILILLLERIYHRTYEHLVSEYLKTHLGMFATKPELSLTEMKRTAQGYDRNNQPQEFVNLKGFLIGPSMNSTTKDMVKFIKAGLSEKDKAIKLTHQLTWGKRDGFGLGLGWMLDNDNNGERYLYHDGNTKLGYNTLCTLYPGKNLGFIIIVNDNMSQDKVGELENTMRRELSK